MYIHLFKFFFFIFGGIKKALGVAVNLYKNDTGKIRTHLKQNAEKFIVKNLRKVTPKPLRPLLANAVPQLLETVEEKALYAVDQFLS